MEVFVIRHGHRADKEPEYDGGFNTPLSERGREQAEQLGAFMAEQELDALYSSHYLRALETAEPVHRQAEIEWNVWPVFGEFANRTWLARVADEPDRAADVASWQTGEPIDEPTPEELEERRGNYYTLSEIPDEFPGATLTQPFTHPDAWWAAQDGQTRTTGLARVGLAVQALMHRHAETEDRVAVVSHLQSGSGLISTLLGYPNKEEFRPFYIDNTGVSRLMLRDEGHWRMYYLNRLDHLDQELR